MMMDVGSDSPPAVETGSSSAGGQPAGRGSRRWLVGALAVALAVVTSLVVVLATRDGDDRTATQGSTTPVEPATTASSGASTTAAGQASPPPADQATAAAVLEPFLSAAATMDEQLRAAAAAINAAGPPWETVGKAVARSVQAAMQSFAYTRPPGEPVDRELLAELGNGHAAAERFAGDLAAARALADSLPAVTVAASDSRQAAELLLLLQYVQKANWGCDSRGGFVATELPPIDWQTETSGTIGTPVGIEFTATLGPDRQWQVNILAC
jgi:hypothetical protein